MNGKPNREALRDRFIRETEEYLTAHADDPNAAWERRDAQTRPELKLVAEADDVGNKTAPAWDGQSATIPIQSHRNVKFRWALGDLEIAIDLDADEMQLRVSRRRERRIAG
jgi:hypothetical protein